VLVAHNPVSSAGELIQRLTDARAESDRLFGIVRSDALYERPIPDRHRIVFYLGHLEAFDANLWRETAGSMPSFHPEFDRLFAFGIDPVGTSLPSDRPSEWPSLEEVQRYSQRLRGQVDDRLITGTRLPDTILNVAIEHRLMHCETLAYMLHRLPLEQKVRVASKPAVVSTEPLKAAMVGVPAGPVVLGMPSGGAAFGWDNEFEAHTIEVPAFTIDKYKITNGQYLEFTRAGGYETRAFWNAADWEWRVAHGISHPAFWRRSGEHWRYRAMFEEISLPLDWPVYVSHAEASAYARWAGKKLPTEAQWQRAAHRTPEEPRGNADFERWDPTPVHAFPECRSACGAVEMIGNGWEWTSTRFAPFAGFRPFPFYPGYSANFFDGRHYVMKGGSPRTAACMLRPSFRNWFQPHYPYVYAGFRCVSN
jgi:iron(II)-dependent oxidoreductase